MPSFSAPVSRTVSVERLVRFHLVDNARGQTLPFAPEEIVAAVLVSEVLGRDGPRVALTLEGYTRANAAGPWLLGENLWKPKVEHPHGMELELVGRAVFDLERGRFTYFELVGLGKRWGRTQLNGRRRGTLAGVMGFHLTLVGDAPNVAPTFIAVYDADWVDFGGSELSNR